MNIQPLIPANCRKCECVDESRFEMKGPHLKQICPKCESYLSFYPKSKFPSTQEIKNKIWEHTTDLDLIKFAKEVSEFKEKDGLNEQFEYWRLYEKIIEFEG